MGTGASADDARKILSFRTNDLDEAADFLRRNFVDHTRVPRKRGPLGFGIEATATDRSVAGSVSFAIPSTVRTANNVVSVHLPLRFGADYRLGRRHLRSATDVAVMLAPQHVYTVDTPPGSVLGIQLDPSLLREELESVSAGPTRHLALRSIEMPLSPAESSAFASLVRQHRAVVSTACQDDAGEALQDVERRIAGWLADRTVASMGLRTVSRGGRRAAELVECWIREHASEPITVSRLSAVAGVGPRALQKACLSRWGQTPLELVASRRLALARRLLAAAGATRTVTEAAARAGFTHLGRFAVQYRQTFGESPSDTLAGRPGRN
jgi:AraC-like DNA-binding protein